MEFTKLFKYVSASLFLILLAHGLILGFSIPTTIISIALLLVCFLMEQKLVKHERDEVNTKIQEILTKCAETNKALVDDHMKAIISLHDKYEMEHKLVIEKLGATQSQISTMKAAQGMSSIRKV